ncbi:MULTISPECIES: hypothetical protein [Clostridium]|uniref:Uncharacterized protein n=1 Tax=Clostridium senegalense TaxID=1465809 RepID=A0A6M0H646_9CLOT|nr:MULTISPECIES: hypothetical protein [Clostridium]MBU5227588.1 hypothetical protein [Clostridium senegalense]NEU06185.1 hypothetical protein [Clostridium senegalense]
MDELCLLVLLLLFWPIIGPCGIIILLLLCGDFDDDCCGCNNCWDCDWC